MSCSAKRPTPAFFASDNLPAAASPSFLSSPHISSCKKLSISYNTKAFAPCDSIRAKMCLGDCGTVLPQEPRARFKEKDLARVEKEEKTHSTINSSSLFPSLFVVVVSLLDTLRLTRMILQASSAPALESLAQRQNAKARTARDPLPLPTKPNMSSRQMPGIVAPRRLRMAVAVSALAEAPPRAASSSSSASSSSFSSGGGHAALLHGLGAVGDVPPKLMPFLLRLAHVK